MVQLIRGGGSKILGAHIHPSKNIIGSMQGQGLHLALALLCLIPLKLHDHLRIWLTLAIKTSF
jgi:hypothetical protein